MANLGVIQSFTGPDGRQILSIRPDAFQTAVKAAMATPDGAETALRAGIAPPDIMDRPQSDPLLGKLVTLIENADPAAQRRLLDLLEGQAVKLHDLLTNPPETHEPGNNVTHEAMVVLLTNPPETHEPGHVLLEGQAVKLHDLLTNPPETHEPGHVRKR